MAFVQNFMNFRLKLSELRNLTWKTLKKRSEQLSVAQNEILNPDRSQEIQVSAVLWCAKRHVSESFTIPTLSERIWNATLDFSGTHCHVYRYDREAYPPISVLPL